MVTDFINCSTTDVPSLCDQPAAFERRRANDDFLRFFSRIGAVFVAGDGLSTMARSSPAPLLAVRRFRRSLRRSDATVVLAVSGGADSTALARLWQATQTEADGRVVVAHFNHGWRGAESDADAEFVRTLADSCGWEVEIAEADRAARSGGGGEGLEAAARRRRYDFLAEVGRRHGARYLATAHTADDQAETVLLRLLRGAGVAGLAGIPRFRRHSEPLTIVRPLLSVRRAALRAYLTDIEQAFRHDSTNADPGPMRNRVRLQLLPWLESEFSPRIVERLLRTSEAAAEATADWAAAVEAIWEPVVVARTPVCVELDCDVLAAASPSVRRQLLVRVWNAQGWPARQMNRARWRELLDCVRRAALISPARSRPSGVAPRMFPGGVRAVWSTGRLKLERPAGGAG